MRPASSGPASRPTDATRRSLLNAAVVVFADRGYEAASVRHITGRAKVNQGAITYHFGGKEGLYRDVLRLAREAMGAQSIIDLGTLDGHSNQEALRLFFRQMLAPLAEGVKFKRYLRIFAWEQLNPTVIRQRLSLDEPFPAVVLAYAVVRRFMPAADERRVGIAAAWLVAQAITFVRDSGYLAEAPFHLAFDRAGVDDLAATLAELSFGGLANLSSP